MTSEEEKSINMAESFLHRAWNKLDEAREHLKKFNYPESISASQECIELSVNAIFLLLQKEYPREHEFREEEFENILKMIPAKLKYLDIAKVYLYSKFWLQFYTVAKYGLEKLSYYFELYDKEGKKIFETPKETSFIYPNETRWLIIQNVKAPEFDDFKPKVEINDYDWKEFEEKFSSRDLIYYEPKIEKLEIGGYLISFNVYNSSIYDFDKIEAIIFLYNKENSQIGLARTYFQIKSKETQKVESIIDFLSEEPEAVEIFFQMQK